jgi:hypothetical protein
MWKRRHETTFEELNEFDLDSLHESIWNKGGQALAAKAILDLALRANLTLTDLRKAKETLPPLASARWEDVALKFGLDPSKDTFQLQSFSVPHAFLPPSFHEAVMKASAQWLDVYQERGAHKRANSARARLMDAVCIFVFPCGQPVSSIFSGTFQYVRCSKAAWSTSLEPCMRRQKLLGAKLSMRCI